MRVCYIINKILIVWTYYSIDKNIKGNKVFIYLDILLMSYFIGILPAYYIYFNKKIFFFLFRVAKIVSILDKI